MLALVLTVAALGHQARLAPRTAAVVIEAGYRPGFSYPGALTWAVSVSDTGYTHYILAGQDGVTDVPGIRFTSSALTAVADTVERVGFFSLCPSYSTDAEGQPTVWLRVAHGGLVHHVSVTGPALQHDNEDVVAFMEVWRQVVRGAGEPPSHSGHSPFTFTFTFGYS